MDTANKRFSAVNVQAPWRGIGIFPSGTVDQPARYALAHLYSGFEASAELQLDAGAITVAGQSATTEIDVALSAGAIGVAGQSLATDIDVALGAGAITVAGQAATTEIDLALTAGALTLAGQDITLLAEQSFELELEAGAVSIAGEDVSLAITVVQSGGHYWPSLADRKRKPKDYRAELDEQRKREREELRQLIERAAGLIEAVAESGEPEVAAQAAELKSELVKLEKVAEKPRVPAITLAAAQERIDKIIAKTYDELVDRAADLLTEIVQEIAEEMRADR